MAGANRSLRVRRLALCRAGHARLRRLIGADRLQGLCAEGDRQRHGRASRLPGRPPGNLGWPRLGKPGGRGAGRAPRRAQSRRRADVSPIFSDGLCVADPPAPGRPSALSRRPVSRRAVGLLPLLRTHFEQTVTDFDADIPATLASIYRQGNPAAAGQVSPTAKVTLNGGRYGAAHRAPPTAPDPALWPPADFDTLVEAFRVHGFRPPNAWYLNDSANVAYARAAPHDGGLRQPVLFINGDFDPICDITGNRLGEPMRGACRDLSVRSLDTGHWLPLERKTESIQAIRSWLKTKGL